MSKSVLDRIKALAGDSGHKYSYDDLMEIRKKGAIDKTIEININTYEAGLNSILGRSGIMPIHQGCSVENFITKTQNQSYARNFAKYYIETFDSNHGNAFVFSGDTGTGKNHLSAAICNALMAQGKTCLIITVSELMIKSRKCYGDNPEYTEDQFIKQLIKFDLLILDEIGLQKGTDHEKIILNQVIDQRIGNLKPVGILTNLDKSNVAAVLGPRIFDRLRSQNQWIQFDWDSYR